ncbi:quinon protein alcohol dehydrogenase-like superfamily [Suillus subalutaceus]|uniref:quinon protein alcohol dehydrogenase-like superfamily n=1 Tax=Suillus subalutaceus TaxID=48586 RepID=UPI001B87982B|nr:quinon protein alcohol dehydrogenase-like superfamily [Suillus subalutaceus]KAG1862764.1 quinon protein alcohol dehydrogenase-like superfamily [Suillus subalutaceus]
MYSPDETKMATGGHNEHAVKIWDAKTGNLLDTLEHDQAVFSLAWVSNGKRLISASRGPIRIFDTTTWQQTAILEGHTKVVRAISLSRNDRLLAIGLPLQHKHRTTVECAAFSADGELLVTGGENNNVYVWDVLAVLKEAGLKDLLLPIPDAVELIDTDATRDEEDYQSGFFDSTNVRYNHSSATNGNRSSTHPRHNSRHRRPLAPSFGNASVLIAHLSTLFRRTPSNIHEATELQQRPRRSVFSRVVEVAATRDKRTLVQPHGQSQGQAQSLPSQSQHAAAPTSTTPPAPDTNTATPGTTSVRINLLPLLARLVLFLCCTSLPHANDH